MIVELALILPLLMSILLAYVGVGYLFLKHHDFVIGADVLAQMAAADPSEGWRSKVPSENERTGCNASPLQPTVEYPDGTGPGSRVLLTWACRLHTRWLFDGLPVTVTSEAVVR